MEHPHYTSSGNETLEAMAARLIAQWQQHFATMLNDPEAVQAMLTLAERMQRFYQFPYQPNPFSTGNAHETGPTSQFSAGQFPFGGFPFGVHAAAPEQPKPAAGKTSGGMHDRPQPGADAGDVAKLIVQLSAQLGRIESRLDALEQPAPPAKPTA